MAIMPTIDVNLGLKFTSLHMPSDQHAALTACLFSGCWPNSWLSIGTDQSKIQKYRCHRLHK